MALPVIANTARVTWNFATSGGITPRIVQHFRSTTGDEVELGELIWAAVDGGIFAPMHQNYEPESLTVLWLDGASAGVTVPNPDIGTPQLCEGTGDLLPSSAAVLSFYTGTRGPSGRGRSYIGPIVEGQADQGYLPTGTRTAMNTSWTTFMTALATGSPAVTLVVASYADEVARTVTSGFVREVLGTQRRRQDQLRH